MKLDKLFDIHVLAGVALGIYLGLNFPALSDHKMLLGIVALVMGLKVVGALK